MRRSEGVPGCPPAGAQVLQQRRFSASVLPNQWSPACQGGGRGGWVWAVRNLYLDGRDNVAPSLKSVQGAVVALTQLST